MIEILHMKAGDVVVRLCCAVCGIRATFGAPSKTSATAQAKRAGWRLLRGDAFCGDKCNTAGKEAR